MADPPPLIRCVRADDVDAVLVYRELMPEPFANRATVVVKALLNPVMRIEVVSTAVLG